VKEYVSDDDEIARGMYNETTLEAFGCTSRGQAWRAGKWLLETAKRESSRLTFQMARDAIGFTPGDIVEIMDNNYAGTRLGGRIMAHAGKVITVDADVSELVSPSDSMSIMDRTGKMGRHEIVGVAGRNITLRNAPAWVRNGTVFAISTSEVSVRLFRILGPLIPAAQKLSVVFDIDGWWYRRFPGVPELKGGIRSGSDRHNRYQRRLQRTRDPLNRVRRTRRTDNQADLRLGTFHSVLVAPTHTQRVAPGIQTVELIAKLVGFVLRNDRASLVINAELKHQLFGGGGRFPRGGNLHGLTVGIQDAQVFNIRYPVPVQGVIRDIKHCAIVNNSLLVRVMLTCSDTVNGVVFRLGDAQNAE